MLIPLIDIPANCSNAFAFLVYSSVPILIVTSPTEYSFSSFPSLRIRTLVNTIVISSLNGTSKVSYVHEVGLKKPPIIRLELVLQIEGFVPIEGLPQIFRADEVVIVLKLVPVPQPVPQSIPIILGSVIGTP